MRTMYDAVTAANIPAGARMVAGYIDKIKLEPWSSRDWARFPTAVKVTIVKKASTNAGHVLDVEPGDATPAQAPGWVRMRRAAGADPTIYMNASTWPTVRQAFIDQGVTQPHYWVAKYDGDPAWGAGWAALGCVAKQYRGNVAPGIDISSVADFWPGVDGDDMPITKEDLDAIDARVSAIVRNLVPAIVRDTVRYSVLATDHDPANPATFIFDGRNPVDIWVDTRNRVELLQAAQTAPVPVTVDLDALATKVAALIPAPAVVAKAVSDELDHRLDS